MVSNGPTGQMHDRTGCIVACVIVHGGPTAAPVLARIERSVRADDRTCPYSVTRMAVQFGPSADDILPQVLGDRLARVAGADAVEDLPGSAPAPVVTVGIAAPNDGRDDVDTTRRAMAAGREAPPRIADVLPAVVTVDRPAPTRMVRRNSRHHPVLHRRTRYRPGPRRPVPSSPGAVTTVLVVDPLAPASGRTGYVAQTAAAVIADLGCQVSTDTARPDDALRLAIGDSPIDLVVLALDGGRSDPSPIWATGTWGVPARLAASYAASGVTVLVVSAGFSAGAVAACVAQGALPVFDVDELPEAVHTVQDHPLDEVRGMCAFGLDPRFRALVGLTPSECRVLFYLTEGWTAQDVADELVVSLATIRSHVSSVLHKLGVKSQLAAVAIANSRDPRRPGMDKSS